MNELHIFKYKENEVRTIMKDGEPWFVLKDVCDVLDIGNNRMVADRLDEDEKGVSITDTLGGKQESTIISESGLYNVILLSRKPEAKIFKRWITHEVIPSIRKHGAYMTMDTIEKVLLDPDAIITIATALKKEQEERKRLQAQIEAEAPKVAFATALSLSEDTILIRELAKILHQNGINIGQNRLFKRLREEGYLIRHHGDDYNSPTQKAIDLGVLVLKETLISKPDGSSMIVRTTKVTGRGQEFFINNYLKKDHLSKVTLDVAVV